MNAQSLVHGTRTEPTGHMQLHEELYKYKSRFTEKNGSNTKKHGSASINRAAYKIFKVSDKDVRPFVISDSVLDCMP